MEIINAPLGFILRTIYNLIGSYGWSLILFTIIVKAILFPLAIKQQKSMAGMAAIQPRLAELQKKYKYDQEKLNTETMKLYKQHKVSPMGGCLPLLIQFPILIGLYNNIRNPLTYILQYSKETIDQIVAAFANMGVALNAADQIPIANAIFERFDEISAALPELSLRAIDFNFWGINLSQTPHLTWPLTPLIIIPVLAGVTTFLSSWLMQKMNGTSSQQSTENGAGSAMKTMNYIFPFITVFFAISMPAGLGFYWTLSNLLQIVQQFLLQKYFSNKTQEAEKQPFRVREANKRRKKK